MPKRTEVRISGSGGQGAVSAGEILGRAAAYDGKHVVQTQSYGAEVRGKAAKSEVIISDTRIGYPNVRRCDILVAMSEGAVETHLKDLKKRGVLIVDEDLVRNVPKTDARVYRIPASKIAEKLLTSRLHANVIMLGALTKITGVVKEEAMERAIVDSLPETATKMNIRGFREGLQLAAI